VVNSTAHKAGGGHLSYFHHALAVGTQLSGLRHAGPDLEGTQSALSRLGNSPVGLLSARPVLSRRGVELRRRGRLDCCPVLRLDFLNRERCGGISLPGTITAKRESGKECDESDRESGHRDDRGDPDAATRDALNEEHDCPEPNCETAIPGE
jgi:hypothetical protein